jgi:hypothetical protein
MGTDSMSRSVGAAAACGSRRPSGEPGPRSRPGWQDRAITAGLRVAGAGLLIAAAAIHLDLYLTGYRSIPVIGGLFLLQVIAGFLAGVVVLVTGSRLAAAAGAVFALATLGGYLLSVWAGLFGFKEVRTTAGIAAGVVEVAAFAALAALAARPRPSGRPSRPGALPGPAAAWLDAGPLGTVALKTTTINGTIVLTNGKGLTLYWFAPDTPARSVCTGACAAGWARSSGPTARSRPPTTGTRCTPTSPTRPPGRPTATTSTSTVAYGTRYRCPAEVVVPASRAGERHGWRAGRGPAGYAS